MHALRVTVKTLKSRLVNLSLDVQKILAAMTSPGTLPQQPRDYPINNRGLVDSTKSSGKNALRQLPSNIELPAEDKSVKRFLTGSRAFHGSRAASESAKGAYLNRPLSPHLPLKKPQLSATYSISHRIFGVGVASAILLFPLAMKFSTLFDI